jgi:hypothetical protein
MSDPVELICELANCSREDAERSYKETKDVVESVDRLLAKHKSVVNIPKVTRSHEKKDPILQNSENAMKHMSRKIHPSIASKDPLVSSTGSSKEPLPVQKAQQSNYAQECLLPFLGLKG